MPFTFWSQRLRRAAAPCTGTGTGTGASPNVADEIVQAETINRQTLWSTLRIRASLRLTATSPRARPR